MAAKAKTKSTPAPEKKRLKPPQELFCNLYAVPGEYFGNGVQAYIEAYGIDIEQPGAYARAKSAAYENLTKPHLLARIRELMELGPLNPETVDRELAFTIYQNADLRSKVAAIQEYNKVEERVIERLQLSGRVRVEHNVKGMKDDELDAIIKQHVQGGEGTGGAGDSGKKPS